MMFILWLCKLGETQITVKLSISLPQMNHLRCFLVMTSFCDPVLFGPGHLCVLSQDHPPQLKAMFLQALYTSSCDDAQFPDMIDGPAT